MKDTRQLILAHIQRNPGLAASDLAEHFDLSLGAVRHHLTILERDALIQGDSMRQPIGRPCTVYELTQKGEESFPKQYDRLSNLILDTLKEEQAGSDLRSFLRRVADRLIGQSGLHLNPDASVEQRAEHLTDIMEDEGFSLEWKRAGNELFIIQHTCPYQSVVGNHPEVCQLDEQVIQTVMGEKIKRVEHRSRGDCNCVFSMNLSAGEDSNAEPS
ncbi:MAG: winged helix-turn-helix transcriptional regulator [Anaerolineales bacterium]|nr:winged helix-turn-helix transcriptional regulator [Anaerolineales bacterium]